MYYTDNHHYIETHDDTDVKSAKVVKQDDGSHELHVVYTLKAGANHSNPRFLHSTNGVDHRLAPIEPAEAKESKKK